MNADSRSMFGNLADKNGRQVIEDAAQHFENIAAEMRRYVERYDECETLVDKADNVNWSMNYAASAPTTTNLRFDLFAKAQANLQVAAAREQDGS